MALTKQKKASLIEQYAHDFSSEKAVVLIEQSGLLVEDVVSFKKELAKTSARSRVVKKRLFLKTALRSGCSDANLGVLNGSLIALSLDLEDFLPLKIFLKMNKEFKKNPSKKAAYSFLGGWYGKDWKNADYVSQLASIPSKEELVSKLLYLLNHPIQSTVAVFDQIAKKKVE